jgi:predicted DsbA family dithiol-disulfide isomerase
MTAGAPDGQAGMRRAVQEEGGLTLSGQRPTIRLVADLVCPWCCIAFARVQRLLATRPAELVWHPFLLNPHLPTAGVARAYYLERKFGSVSQAKSAYRRIAEAGASEGIRFSFAAIGIQPNTVLAHGLVLRASACGRLAPTGSALFKAFFEEGADIGDPEVLGGIARRLDLPVDAGALAGDQDLPGRVAQAHEEAYALGINGVPVCLFGDDHMIAGAQPIEALAALLDLQRYRSGGAGL